MVRNLPTLGILFDWTIVGTGTYGRQCWKIFWRAIDPLDITAAVLWEGDADCNENYYCIAVQSADPGKLNRVKEAISQSAEFKKIAAYPAFIEGAECTREPLVDAGRIDATGRWIGNGGNAGIALDLVRKDRESAEDSGSPPAVPVRSSRPSQVTENLPKWTSFAALDEFCKRQSSIPRVLDSEFFWITPEELCDIVESAADIVEVYYTEYSCANSSDLCRVALRDKTGSSNWLSFSGLYPVPSIQHFVNEWDFPREYQTMRPVLAGAKGRLITNFNRDLSSGSLSSKDVIEVGALWPRLYRRRAKFLAETERDEAPKKNAAEPAKRREDESCEREAVSGTKTGEEEQDRRHLQGVRQSHGLCVMCGAGLGMVDRIFGRAKHKRCFKFTE